MLDGSWNLPLIALALLQVPIVIRTTENMLKLVPIFSEET